MPDRKTKALLLAIALGLWANVATQWIRPESLHAQGTSDATQREMAADIARLRWTVGQIANVARKLATGTCPNKKLC